MERGRSAGHLHLDGSGKGSKGKNAQGGLLPSSWLLGLFAGAALIPDADALLRLWDGCLLRGDRFLGLYLAAALLLRRKTELLALQGPALRARLEEIITGGGGAASAGASAGGGLPPVGEWLEEADRLARLTPLSLRVHLTALERAAASETPRRLSRAREEQPPPLMTPTPPQGPPPPSSSSVASTASPSRGKPAQGMEVSKRVRLVFAACCASQRRSPPTPFTFHRQGYAARLAALTWPRQRAVDEMVQQHQAPYQLTTSTNGSGGAGGGGPQLWGLASPTRRRRALEQAASDPDALALLATKLCLAVAPEEAVPQLCLPSSGYQQYSGVRFFGLDCRPKEQLGAGRYVRSMWVHAHTIQHLITRLSHTVIGH